MALVVFRSRAAAEIVMLGESASRLLGILGREVSERGVVRASDLDEAILRLTRAVEAERAQGPDTGAGGDELPLAGRPVTLGQRAWPLLEMMRAARRRGVDVTWGI